MTKLEAWKEWGKATGVEDLSTEFALENSSHGKTFSFAWDRASLAEPVQEPVAWWNGRETVWFEHELMGTNPPIENALPLYTAPTPRRPLTDGEILRVLMLSPPEPSLWPHLKGEAVVGDVQRAVIAIARAIERAHGITGEQT